MELIQEYLNEHARSQRELASQRGRGARQPAPRAQTRQTGAFERTLERILFLLTSERRVDNEEALRLLEEAVWSEEQRRRLQGQLIELLASGTYSPSPHGEDDARRQVVRGWLLSGLARVSGREDAAALRVIEQYLHEDLERNDWVRFWALVGLWHVQGPHTAQVARELLEGTAERAPEARNLLRNLAWAILASRGGEQARQVIPPIQQLLEAELQRLRGAPQQACPLGAGQSAQQGAPRPPEGVWEMLRALRIIPLEVQAIRAPICALVELGQYTDATYEALLALGALPPRSHLAKGAAISLEAYLINNPWPSHDNQRVAAIDSLGRLGFDQAADTLLRQLRDDNPSIVRAAARALESILGGPQAVARILEFSQRVPHRQEVFSQLGLALKWMDRSTVVQALDAAMRVGTEEQQSCARELLREVGGTLAFERLHARADVTRRFLSTIDEVERNLERLFERSLEEARKGFKVTLAMDGIVFLVGLVLIALSAWKIFFSSSDEVLRVLLAGGAGVVGFLGALYGTWLAKPREQVRLAADHLLQLKVIFLAYVRQLHQVDQALARRMLDDEVIHLEDLNRFLELITRTMGKALEHLHLLETGDASVASDMAPLDEAQGPLPH